MGLLQGNAGPGSVIVHYPDFHVIVLAIVYAKNEQDDLTAQQKTQIQDFIERQRKALKEGRSW
jgi:myo-inositol catabolism protein IolC